ncbi:MAG: ribonuclease HII [Butyrivibrio sp.]|nr:ribonuclease HII [Butyrivibrio sp.]
MACGEKAAERIARREERLAAERARLYEMRSFERAHEEMACICGIDEVGRGPLAGPVYAGAVILPADAEILYLNDSKKLTEKRREQLNQEIREKAVAVGIGAVEAARIDEIGIVPATLEAMTQAVSELSVAPDLLFVDALRIPQLAQIPQVSIIKGDAKSVSIAAASIVAKVARDRLMMELDEQYPGYGFARNKGYGTKEHIEALKRLGPCPIHRRSFITHFI